ncbi:acyltransferase family protein [Beijerinckia indica]|uniref:Acyltransferase 3 n=1 Tax=Beijerinckia indica subsp. indica (strain ATCC 9039 / DSM 1715 / NCIMB 8712) TaxID=395963 RepID=B2ICX1_BEII9|nr:acyltransferase [Beijerinckia indica]ACB95392.1 acyltransferase 3 [Beijerinckia indica subsp. indica ATCC 9039]
MTLDDVIKANKGRGPGFHFLRHVLALLIFTYHGSIAIFGAHTNDYAGKGMLLVQEAARGLSTTQVIMEVIRPTLYARVGMFFALSGFLVAASALRNSDAKAFFINRVVRIIPALSVAIVFSAMILGPLVTTLPLEEYFSDPVTYRYFGNIIGFLHLTLPGVFTDNPWPGIVNVNLWTLPPEFWCYFAVLGLMVSGLLSKHKLLTSGIILALLIATALDIFDHRSFTVKANNTRFTLWYVIMMFYIGMLFRLNAKYIIMNFWIALGAAVGFYLLMLSDSFGPLSGLLLTYIAIYIGMMMSVPVFDRFLKEDLSYGIYLYGFPLTQAAIFILKPYMGSLPLWERYAIIMVASFGVTLIFAILSRTFIEKPAARLLKGGQKKPLVLPAGLNLPANVSEGIPSTGADTNALRSSE